GTSRREAKTRTLARTADSRDAPFSSIRWVTETGCFRPSETRRGVCNKTELRALGADTGAYLNIPRRIRTILRADQNGGDASMWQEDDSSGQFSPDDERREEPAPTESEPSPGQFRGPGIAGPSPDFPGHLFPPTALPSVVPVMDIY